MLDLTCHDRPVHAFRFESLDQLAELSERHPMNGGGMPLNFRKGFLFDSGDYHFDALASGCLENKEWELTVARDQAVFT
jgi:hypothetical protein